MSKVFIAVGHGGADPGACANGLVEKDLNLRIALAMKAELVKRGAKTRLSREQDATVGLAAEISMCNAYGPALAVEIHNNAGGGKGFEVFRQTGKHAEASRKLAECVESRVIATGHSSRGVKTRLNPGGGDYFGWLREVSCPAILCEGAFLDNLEDAKWLRDAEKLRVLGEAYAQGVLEALGIKPVLYGVARQVVALSDRAAAESYAAKLNASDKTAYYKVLEI
jgi:N-acetylmuramoyl-L-alanine amidase